MTLRLLTPRDIPATLALAHAAGWNQTGDDIAMLLRLAPEGCFCIEVEDGIAATTTLLPLNPQLAWLGMVLTGAAHRRRGFARQLVRRALDYALELGIATVKLDATDMGRPLYLEMGFRDEQPIERWSGRLALLRPGNDPAPDGPSLLGELAARSAVFRCGEAYALIRPGVKAQYVGPFQAPHEPAARALVSSAFRAGEGDLYYWDVLPHNTAALRLVQDLGFERVRSLVRMVSGPGLRGYEEHVYAIGGFELG
jgi:RimJ/RimL family protein N-acetyltransferase